MNHMFRTQNGIDYLKDAINFIETALRYMEVNPKTCRRDADEAMIYIMNASHNLMQATVHIMRDR